MYEEEEKKPWLWRIITYLFFALGIFIISCFIFRSCKMSDISIADDVIFNEEMISLYEASPDQFKVYTYGLRKRVESVDANQLLQMKYMYYIPSVNQMQVTVKYNTSYADAPTEENLPLILELVDEKGNICDDYFYVPGEKDGYAYVRVSFADVEIDQTSEYILYVYLPEENGEKRQIGKFVMQDANSARKEIVLTKENAPAVISEN